VTFSFLAPRSPLFSIKAFVLIERGNNAPMAQKRAFRPFFECVVCARALGIPSAVGCVAERGAKLWGKGATFPRIKNGRRQPVFTVLKAWDCFSIQQGNRNCYSCNSNCLGCWLLFGFVGRIGFFP